MNYWYTMTDGWTVQKQNSFVCEGLVSNSKMSEILMQNQ